MSRVNNKKVVKSANKAAGGEGRVKRVEGAPFNTVLRRTESAKQRLEGGGCGEAPGFGVSRRGVEEWRRGH